MALFSKSMQADETALLNGYTGASRRSRQLKEFVLTN